MTNSHTSDVFVNCPFDEDYKKMFHALVFTIYKCNFRPRCSLEVDDASEVRLDKIVRIIRECSLAIHDISRTELNPEGLPRFNMPLELGIFLGAKRLGGRKQSNKRCLVLDREPYRYQRFISDIAGQDIKSHAGCAKELIIAVRDWLSSYSSGLESGSIMWEEYNEFLQDMPDLCAEAKLVESELTFSDYVRLVFGWLEVRETTVN